MRGWDTTPKSRSTWEDLGFREAFAGAPVGLGIMDPELRYVWVNEVFASVNGLPATDHVGRTLSEVVPNLAVQVAPLIRGVLTTGVPVTGHQMRGERPGRPGQVLDWLVSYFPIRDTDGSLVSCGVLLQEDTEHARTVAALDESHERTRRILETALDAVIGIDAQGLVTDWDGQAEAVFGWRADEVVGRSLAELIVPPRYREAHRDGLRRYVETGESRILGQRIELPALRRDGSEIPVELAIAVVSGGEAPAFSAFVRDLSDRRDADAAVRLSDQRLRSVIETAPSGIVVVDAEGAITLVNRAAEEMFGYTRDELVGSSIERLVSASVRDQHVQERSDYLLAPETRLMGIGRDLFAVRSDGTEFPVEVGLSAAQTEEGPVVTAIVTDISERVLEAERTRKTLDRLRRITEVDRKILAADRIHNVVAEALRGLAEQVPNAARVALGMVRGSEFELFAVESEDPSAVVGGTRIPLDEVPGIERLGSGEMVITDDLSTVSGSQAIDALVSEGIRSTVGLPLMAEGKLLGALGLSALSVGAFSEDDLGIAGDVAAQLSIAIRTAELRDELESRAWRMQTLHEVERAILSAASVRELAHSALANLALRIANRWISIVEFSEDGTEAQVIAIEPGEAPDWLSDGARASDLGDISDLQAGHVRVVTDSREEPVEHRLAHALSEVGALSYTVLPMIMDGSLLGVLVIYRDLTGSLEPDEIAVAAEIADSVAIAIQQSRLRDAAQSYAAQLEQRVATRTSELMETNAQLDAFAYSVSHDLRAPLRAMEGFSQALMEDYGEILGDTGRDYAERVVRAAARMDQLIKDMLAYSRLTRAELPLGPVDLRPLVDEALEQARGDPVAAGADLTTEGTFPSVIGHRSTIQQILANLLTNAVKFVAEGVRPKVRVWAEDRGAVVRVCVGDNGIGVDPEFHVKIFGVLERLHGADRYPGTGIGLAIVAKGAERMRGRAGVGSSPGQGSIFWVELPTANEGGA